MNRPENDNTPTLTVQVIDTYAQFKELKTAWEEIYLTDPYATFYISWLWFSGWLKITSDPWFILAVRDEVLSSYIGFLPLKIRRSRIKKLQAIRLLRIGGEPISVINGLIYKIGYESEVIKVLAEYIKGSIRWDKFQMRNLHEHHAKLFTDQFSNKKFKVSLAEGLPSSAITLPSSWEGYQKNILGAQTRKTLIRLSNKINSDANITMTEVSEETVDKDIDVLLALWQSRYGIKRTAAFEKKMFRHYFDHGKLWLNIYWDGSKPISAQACIIDNEKETCYAYMTGYDSAYAQLSPGKVIGMISTKLAIEQGLKYYNFLLGNDGYKLSLGAELQSRSGIHITRKSQRTYLAVAINTLLSIIKNPFKKMIG